jgi:multiple sugar transport system permease protein
MILWRVVMPVAAPAAVVAAVFAFLTGWGDLVVATVLTGPSSQTVAVALNSFLQVQEGGAVPAYGALMAASIVSALPVVIIFVALQRFFISGLTGSASKG